MGQDSPSDIEATNRVFAQVKLPLERVYSTFVANGEPGWSLQTYTDFVEEFGLLRDLKVLTVHRIFYALADMPEKPPRVYLPSPEVELGGAGRQGRPLGPPERPHVVRG